MIILQMAALFDAVCLFFGLWYLGNVPAVYGVAAGSSCNWVLRTVFSLAVVRPFLRERALPERAG